MEAGTTRPPPLVPNLARSGAERQFQRPAGSMAGTLRPIEPLATICGRSLTKSPLFLVPYRPTRLAADEMGPYRPAGWEAGWGQLDFALVRRAAAVSGALWRLCSPFSEAQCRLAAGALPLVIPALARFLGGRPREAVTGGYVWVPTLDVRFSWFLDGLSLTFALLITGIGTLIVLYSGGYLKGHPQQGRFLAFIFMFMGAMLGLVVSDSFLMLFVFWELTSITSFLLIGFDHEREPRAALPFRRWSSRGGRAVAAGRPAAVYGTSPGSRAVVAAGAGRDRSRQPALFSRRCCSCSAAPSPNRRSFRSISGCRTPWRRRPRSRPTCIRRPW